jgi:hypothetical protein
LASSAPERVGARDQHRLRLVLHARVLEGALRVGVGLAEAELDARRDGLAVLEAVVGADRDHLRAPGLRVEDLARGGGAEGFLRVDLREDVAGVECLFGRPCGRREAGGSQHGPCRQLSHRSPRSVACAGLFLFG